VAAAENKMAGRHPPRSKRSRTVRPSPWSPPSRQQSTDVRDCPPFVDKGRRRGGVSVLRKTLYIRPLQRSRKCAYVVRSVGDENRVFVARSAEQAAHSRGLRGGPSCGLRFVSRYDANVTGFLGARDLSSAAFCSTCLRRRV